MAAKAHTDFAVQSIREWEGEEPPTFERDRDDEYFNAICPPELVAEIRATAQAAYDAQRDARHARFDEAYAAHVATQVKNIRASVHARYEARNCGLWDDEARTFVAYPADQVDYFPVAQSRDPEPRVYRGVSWTGVDVTDTSHDRFSRRELVEYLAGVMGVVVPESPARKDLPKVVAVDDSESAVEERWTMDEDALEYSQRDEDPALVSHRWNRPDDELELLDIIAEQGLDAWNVEILTLFRKWQLHTLCQWYFGTSDYYEKEIVLQWVENDEGRHVPGVKMLVSEWIESLLDGVVDPTTYDEKGGDSLRAFYSAAQTLRYKLMRKGRGVTLNSRILSPEAVRLVAHRAVAMMSQEAVDDYFEL